MILSSL
jgi:hypothetical protein